MLENRQPVFIPENALSDPRIKYFPELEEEKYQSLVSVPLVIRRRPRDRRDRAARRGAARLQLGRRGVPHPHRLAGRAGAIENARLYERTRRSLRELEQLSRLGLTIARAETVDELLAATVEHGVELLRAESLRIYLIEPLGRPAAPARLEPDDGDGPETRLAARARQRAAAQRGGRRQPHLAARQHALGRSRRCTRALVAPLVTGDEVLGFLVARLDGHRRAREHERDVANSVASQTAVGLKRLQLTDRLAERNLIKDLFDDLADGTAGSAVAARARRLGVDLDAPHLVLTCLPAPAPAASASAEAQRFAAGGRGVRGGARAGDPGAPRSTAATSCCARSCPSARPARTPSTAPVTALRGARRAWARGVSSPCSGPAACSAGLAEARQAARRAARRGRPGARCCATTTSASYKYLLRVPLEDRVRDRHGDALRRLRDHDRRRQTQLLRTLEEFLRQRGNMAATAKALYVHPNTLRQRLRRIADLTGLDPRTDDWLMIEIACKLLKLEEVYPPARPTRRPAPGGAGSDRSTAHHEREKTSTMATVTDEPKTGLDRELFEPDWFLTDEQNALRERLIEICEKEIRPRAAGNDRDLIVPAREPRGARRPTASSGCMLPKEWGGLRPEPRDVQRGHRDDRALRRRVLRHVLRDAHRRRRGAQAARDAVPDRQVPEEGQGGPDRHALATPTRRRARTSGTRSPPARAASTAASRC